MTSRILAHSPGQPESDRTNFNLVHTQEIREWNANRKEGQPMLEETMCPEGLGDRVAPVVDRTTTCKENILKDSTKKRKKRFKAAVKCVQLAKWPRPS